MNCQQILRTKKSPLQLATDVNIPVHGQVCKYITSDIVNGHSVNTQEVFQSPENKQVRCISL